MKILPVLGCVLALVANLTADDKPGTSSDKAWNVRDHVPLARFIIQGHRGAGELAPENTIEAFELGWKMGIVPEADIRTTKDKVIVAFHDANFSRVVKGVSDELKDKGVKDLTFDELSKLDVGAWRGDAFQGRRVSKISEVFEQMRNHPERRLYLDIKEVDLKQLAEEVKEYKVEKQVVLASPKHEIIRTWKGYVPESGTLLWMGGQESTLKKRLDDLRASNFAGVTELQVHIHLKENPDVTADEPFKLPKAFLKNVGEELRPRGILYQTLPYYTSEPKVFWTLMDLGVASFSTDYPDVALKAVQDYYAKAVR